MRFRLCLVLGCGWFGVLSTAAQAAWDELKVLSFNIHHGEGTDGRLDLVRVAEAMLRLDPDVVALQEADWGAWRTDGVDQLKVLAGLTGWEAAFGATMPFQGGQYGSAILSRYPLSERITRALPFRTGQEPRGLVVATVTPNNGLPPFRFVSTHWSHDREDVRLEQATQIGEWLGKNTEPLPLILAGDFNSRPAHAPMTALTNLGWTIHTGEPSMIDHVLTRSSDSWTLEKVEVVEDRVTSDHRPLLVTLRWTGVRHARLGAAGFPGTLMVMGSLEDTAMEAAREALAELSGETEKMLWLTKAVSLEALEQAKACLDAGGIVVGPRRLLMLVPGVRFELGEHGILTVSGRRVWATGKGGVKILLPASGNREAEEKVLEEGERADLTALRRATVERRWREPFPAAVGGVPLLTEGTLILAGGGGLPPEVLDRFFETGGGEEMRLAIVPISAPPPLRRPHWLEREAKRRGVAAVKVLDQRTPREVDDVEILTFLQEATAVWFGGGRQWRFVDAYEDTEAVRLFHGVLRRGGVIGGSSAGASIQAEYMVRGNPLGSWDMMAEGYERGFGFLPGAAVDQHFRQRNRFPDMTRLMREHPQLLGIGLDEGTALVVVESRGEVVGKGEVHVYDRRREMPGDGPDHLSLGAGAIFDLVDREIVRPR